MVKSKKMEMTEVGLRKGTKELGVSASPYFSKVYNVINQMLFSVKAEDVAESAIQMLKDNKAPVIAFSSTMGAFLESFENDRRMTVQDWTLLMPIFPKSLNVAYQVLCVTVKITK